MISAPYEIADHQIVIGVSIGIALSPQDGDNPDQLLKNADLALYRAKADGRGTYRFFETGMDRPRGPGGFWRTICAGIAARRV